MLRVILVLAFILSGCQSTKSIKRRNADEIYQGAGIERYILPLLPYWASYSTIGQCHHSPAIRYLDFSQLGIVYNLSYEQLVQLQLGFNDSLVQFKKQNQRTELRLDEEAFLFNRTVQKIEGGSKVFLLPKYKRVNIVWLDPALNDKKLMTNFMNLMKSTEIESGHPIIISSCLNRSQLDTFVNKVGLNELGVRIISSEMFSIYDSQLKPRYSLSIDLDEVVPNKIINFYAPYFPKEFKGSYQLKKY